MACYGGLKAFSFVCSTSKICLLLLQKLLVTLFVVLTLRTVFIDDYLEACIYC